MHSFILSTISMSMCSTEFNFIFECWLFSVIEAYQTRLKLQNKLGCILQIPNCQSEEKTDLIRMICYSICQSKSKDRSVQYRKKGNLTKFALV